MDALIQPLYEYITDGEIQKYWGMTDYYTCQMVAQHTNQVFTEQLTEEQLPLRLRLEEASNTLQCASLEAIFLSTADFCRDLSRRF